MVNKNGIFRHWLSRLRTAKLISKVKKLDPFSNLRVGCSILNVRVVSNLEWPQLMRYSLSSETPILLVMNPMKSPFLWLLHPLFMAQSPNLLRFQQVSIDDGTHLWPNLVVQHLTEETTTPRRKKSFLELGYYLSMQP